MFVISMDIIFIARPKSDYSTIEKRILEQHHIPDWKSMKTGRYQLQSVRRRAVLPDEVQLLLVRFAQHGFALRFFWID